MRSRFGTHSSSNTRICDCQIAGLLQRSDSQFPADAGEVDEELIERVAAFEIIEQRLERDAGSGEAGGAPHDLGVAEDRR